MSRRTIVGALLVCAVGVAVLTFGPSPAQALYDGAQQVPGLDALPFGAIERAANVALFVPVGFLLQAALPRLPGVLTWLLCTAASLGVEVVQLVLPDRQPTLRDVVLNSLGAALGVALHAFVVRLRASSSRK